MTANLTLIVHFAFILFVVFGALLFFVSTKIVFIHIPAIIWGSYIELTHSICPLTYLENWFLHKANLTTYSEGFIQNYLVPIVYPTNLSKDLQIHLGITLLVINIIIYGLIISKIKKIKSLCVQRFSDLTVIKTHNLGFTDVRLIIYEQKEKYKTRGKLIQN